MIYTLVSILGVLALWLVFAGMFGWTAAIIVPAALAVAAAAALAWAAWSGMHR